ncbi:MAG: hypothetical protein OHK0011_17810 [Turneriella sp.]
MRVYARLVVLLLTAGALGASNSSESSFQLAPAPVPYPYFEPGATDGKSTQTGSNSSYLQLSVGYVFSNRPKTAEKPADVQPGETAAEETNQPEPAAQKPAAKKAPTPKAR